MSLPGVEWQGITRVSLMSSTLSLGAGTTRYSAIEPCHTMVRVIGSVRCSAGSGEVHIEQANDSTGVYFPARSAYILATDTPLSIELKIRHPFIRARLVNSSEVTMTGIVLDLWLLPV